MELRIHGRSVGVTDRFREHATEKADKLTHLAERAEVLEVKVSRHAEKHGAPSSDRAELTLVAGRAVVRAEAVASDKFAAFDVAFARLTERVRRAKDRRKPHHGGRRALGLREATDHGFADVAVQAASSGILAPEHGAAASADPEATTGAPEDEDAEPYCPVVIRQKVFTTTPMTVDDALYHMELVGHDFYLFLDVETERPSVVYRRKGWDYGVIALDIAPAAAE